MQIVPKIPILDYILNTPSLHRVHHGRNPYCIDRNYGGVLSIWDRLFGTLAEERDNEKVHYGLIQQVDYYDCVKLQFSLVKYYLIDKPMETQGDILTKIKSIVYPPAWNSETPDSEISQSAVWKRMRRPEEGVPPVQGTRQRRKLEYSSELKDLILGPVPTRSESKTHGISSIALANIFLAAYGFGHFLLIVPPYFVSLDSAMRGTIRYAYLSYCIATLYAVTAAFDQRIRLLCALELLRNTTALYSLLTIGNTYNIFMKKIGWGYIITHEFMSSVSLILWIIIGGMILKKSAKNWRVTLSRWVGTKRT